MKKQLHDYMMAMPGVVLEFPFGDEAAVYKVDITPHKKSAHAGSTPDLKMFAIINEVKDPTNISLKCDPELAKTLREKYESVMPGYHLNKKHWNTIVCSGQLSDQEILDLVDHSYKLVAGIKQ